MDEKLIKCKPGVSTRFITTAALRIIEAAVQAWKMLDRQDTPVITSWMDGKHINGSKHFSGLALDFRTRILTESEKHRFTQALRDELGRDFDVVLESDHLHVEYDPKRSRG